MKNEEEPLEDELRAVRLTLKEVRRAVRAGEDLPKHAALVARLCDTSARLLLARQRLVAGTGQEEVVNDTFDGGLRVVGLGGD